MNMMRINNMNVTAETTSANLDAQPKAYCLPTTISTRSNNLLTTTSLPPSSSSLDPRRSCCNGNSVSTTGQLRFPCRARGLGHSINRWDASSDTDSILVPANAEHGLLVRCSNDECVASGRMFRWCSVCKTVAAKRNFWQRHGHSFTKKQMPKYYQRDMKFTGTFSTKPSQERLPSIGDTLLSSRNQTIHSLSQQGKTLILHASAKVSSATPDLASSMAGRVQQAEENKHCSILLATALELALPDTSLPTTSASVGTENDTDPLFAFVDGPGEWSDGEMEGLFEEDIVLS